MVFTDSTQRDEKSFNDCHQCVACSYCTFSSPNTTCDAGRFCLDVTEDEKQYAARPGTKIPTTGNNEFTDETVCGTEGYCPQASCSAQSCPAGYNLNVQSYTHSQYNCQPNSPGLYMSSSGTTTTCTAGSYCPEAV